MRHLSTSSLALFLALAGCVSQPSPSPGVDGGSDDTDATPTGPPDAAPPPATDPMAEFSACMDQGVWEANNVSQWAVKPSSFGTICADCHGDGLEHFYTNLDPAQMFEYNRYQVFITGFFTVTRDENDEVMVIANTAKLDRVANGDANHPLFNATPGDQDVQNLEAFAQTTWERVLQNRDNDFTSPCGEPAYPEPPVGDQQ